MEAYLIKLYVAVIGLPERAPQGQKRYYGAFTLQAKNEEAIEVKRLTRTFSFGTETTVNRALMQLIIDGLNTLKSLQEIDIFIVSNNESIVRCGQGKWDKKANADLWQQIDTIHAKAKAQGSHIFYRMHNEDPDRLAFDDTKNAIEVT